MIRAVWRHTLMSLLLFAAGNAVRVNGVDVSYQRFMGRYQRTF